jgi:hypothetical protein
MTRAKRDGALSRVRERVGVRVLRAGTMPSRRLLFRDHLTPALSRTREREQYGQRAG